MGRTIKSGYSEKVQRYASVCQQLTLLDYRKTLERGYVLVKKDGKFITSARKLHPLDEVELLFHDGEHSAVISKGKRP